MNKIKRFVGLIGFSLMILSLPAIASAQWRNDDNNRNGGNYPNQGGYGNYGDMRSTVRNLKDRTRQLQREVDRDLDRGRYDGSNREDSLNNRVREFRNAVNDLDNNPRYDRNDSNEIRRVHQAGSQLERVLSRARLGYNVQNLWSQIRHDLQALGGNGYDNNNRNNRNRNRRNTGGNGNGNNLPNWWPF